MGDRPHLVTAVTCGAALVLILWLLLVPWDLSEVDRLDRLREQGLQNTWPRVVLVGGSTAAIGAIAAARRRLLGGVFLAGAFITLVGLFVWRTNAARTRGANLWVVGVVFWVPCMAIGFAAAYGVGRLAANLMVHTEEGLDGESSI